MPPKSAAPGLRTISPTRTPGSSQTPYMMACAGGSAVNSGVAAAQSVFQATKTTPNATAMTAATTMSTTRHPLADLGEVVMGKVLLGWLSRRRAGFRLAP